MKYLRGCAGRELKWVQPRALSMNYELRDSGEVAATLRWPSAFSSLAPGESADGRWTFSVKREGPFGLFATGAVCVRVACAKQDLAFFTSCLVGDERLHLADGRTFPARSNEAERSFDFFNPADALVVRYHQSHGVLGHSAKVEILPAAVSLPELPWMVLFGWYFTLLQPTREQKIINS